MSKARRTQLGVRLDKHAATDVAPSETEQNAAIATETGDAADVARSETGHSETVTTPGRPPGAKNRTYDSGERNPGKCKKCKCTESLNERKKIIPLSNDPEYTHVELITCCCKKCGQWRVDRQKCNPAE
jgi:hypothetical protein